MKTLHFKFSTEFPPLQIQKWSTWGREWQVRHNKRSWSQLHILSNLPPSSKSANPKIWRVATITLMVSPDNCCTVTARTDSMAGVSPGNGRSFAIWKWRSRLANSHCQSFSHSALRDSILRCFKNETEGNRRKIHKLHRTLIDGAVVELHACTLVTETS